MAEQTATVETNEQRRADKLTRLARRDLAYRAKVAAGTELRLRKRNAELVALGFEPVDSYISDVVAMTDEALEALATNPIAAD